MYNIYVQEFEYCMTQKTDHIYICNLYIDLYIVYVYWK